MTGTVRPAVDPIGMGGFVDAVTQAKIARAHDVANTLVAKAERAGQGTVVPQNVRDELFKAVFEAPGETRATIYRREAVLVTGAMGADDIVNKAESALVDLLLQRNRCADAFDLTDGARTLLADFAGDNRPLR